MIGRHLLPCSCDTQKLGVVPPKEKFPHVSQSGWKRENISKCLFHSLEWGAGDICILRERDKIKYNNKDFSIMTPSRMNRCPDCKAVRSGDQSMVNIKHSSLRGKKKHHISTIIVER